MSRATRRVDTREPIAADNSRSAGESAGATESQDGVYTGDPRGARRGGELEAPEVGECEKSTDANPRCGPPGTSRSRESV